MRRPLFILAATTTAFVVAASTLLSNKATPDAQERVMPQAYTHVNSRLLKARAPQRFVTFDDLSGKAASTQTEATATSGFLPLRSDISRAVTSGIPTTYGLLENAKDASGRIGMYAIGVDGSSQMLWERPKTDKSDLNSDAETLRTGFFRNGDVYIFERSENGTYGHEAYSSEMFVYDFATGSLKDKNTLSISDSKMQMFMSMAYDSANDVAYAYTISYDIETPYYFVKFKPDNPQVITPIATKELMTTVLALTYHDGYLYGIQYQGYSFVRIDPATGTSTTISKPFASSPIRFSWSGFGMTWVDALDGFVINHVTPDGKSSLDLLHLDGTVEKLVDMPQSEQFGFLFTAGDVSDSSETPAKPVIVGNTFADTPDLTGTFTISMPEYYADGRPISQSTAIGLDAVAGTVAGIPDKSSYAPGETAVVRFDLPADGRYSFDFRATIADGFASAVQMIYVGYDVPSAPSNVVLQPGKVRWDAIMKGSNGGFFVPADVRYDVIIDGQTAATGIEETEWAVDFTEGELSRHTACVVAKHHGHSSEKALSNDLVDGRPMNLDAVFEPTAAQAALFTVIDANSDGSTWEFEQTSDNTSGGTCFKYYLNAYRNADDWLVTPPIKISDVSKLYSFMLEANRVSNYPERFEVCMGTTPDPSTWSTVLIPSTEVPVNAVGSTYQPYTADFNVNSPGTYYFGVHCTSAADMHTLRVRSIKVIDTARSTEGPDAPSEVRITPANDGSLKANVSLRMPVLTISGDDINPLETLTVTVSTASGSKTASGHPGEVITVADVPSGEGFNDFTIVVSQGNIVGKSITVQQYVGADIPGCPENIKFDIDQTNHHVTLSWDPPTTGAHGGYIDPAEVTYTLCYLVEDGAGAYWQTADKLGKRTSIEISYDESAPFIDDLGIVASNSKGMGVEVAQAHYAVGRPWELPMREKFNSTYSQFYPFMIMGNGEEYANSNWGFVDPSKAGEQYANETGMALVGEGYEDGAKGMFGFPKFSTQGCDKVSLAFNVYIGDITPQVDVYAEGPTGVGREKIGSLTADNSAQGWVRIEIPLPSKYCGLGWVQVILDATFATNSQKVLIDTYSFKRAIDYDLAVVSITGPNLPELSRENHYIATIDNLGVKAERMPAGVWRVISNGREIASAVVPASHTDILPDALCSYSFNFTPGTDHIGDAQLSFEIALDDENSANNSAVKSLRVVQGASVAVTDLVATNVKEGVLLQWSEPRLDDGVESFENIEPFLINDDAAWLGNFRNIDVDGQITYSTSGWTNPNAGLPAAFSVWDLDQVEKMLDEAGIEDRTYSAADGKCLAIAFSTGAGYSTDDWLISPRVVGGSEISFKVRAISTAYPETIEVLYSTSDDMPSDFEGKRLLRHTTRDDYAQGDPIKYETISLQLPDDARHFAIRYVSRDMFAVMIDDIHYSPAQAAEGVTAYDVIRDSKTIATGVQAPDCRFTDSDVKAGHTYAYQIVPILGSIGRGCVSNTAWAGVAGYDMVTTDTDGNVAVSGHSIVGTGFEGQTISVSTVDGRIVAMRCPAAYAESFDVAPGVYIFTVSGYSYKLVVK